MPQVLMVCRANLARSPFAAALLRDRLDGTATGCRVRSAGTHATPGERASTGMAAVARLSGVSLRDHRAASLTAELLRASDLVLTMTEQQRTTAQHLLLEAIPRTFTLRELARLVSHPAWPATAPVGLRELAASAHRIRPLIQGDRNVEDIEDPVGSSDRVFERVGKQISESVDAAVAAILRAMT